MSNLFCMFVVLLVLFAASVNLATSITVNFHQSKYIVNEKDQLLQPQVVLNESSSTNITVQIKSIDITATGKYMNIVIKDVLTLYLLTGGGVDYNSGPYNVTFPAGVTSMSLNVTIINDNMLETTETFNLTIVGGSLPTNVTLGITDQTTVTIVNDGGSRKYATN